MLGGCVQVDVPSTARLGAAALLVVWLTSTVAFTVVGLPFAPSAGPAGRSSEAESLEER